LRPRVRQAKLTFGRDGSAVLLVDLEAIGCEQYGKRNTMTIRIDTETSGRKKEDSRRNNITREEILDAAARLVVEEGYGACTMRSVSNKVRIKAGSLYYHFASKDEIIVEIMNLGVTMLLRQVEGEVQALPARSSFKTRIETAIKTHVACKTNTNMPFMQVYEHLPPVMKRHSREMRRKYANFWIKLLADGVASGDVRSNIDLPVFVSYLLGGLNRVPEWYHPKRKDGDKVVRLIAGTVLNGILEPDSHELNRRRILKSGEV
jgi:AcrR family transcriptional regulator